MGFMNEPQVAERRIAGHGTPDAAWQAWPGLAGLQSITAAELLPSGRRAVIVAPHPDDEVLACGGLLQLLHGQGTHVVLLAVTDGDASHPGSRLLTSEDLCRLRPKETAAAMQAMDINPHILRARIGDGQVRSNLQQLQQLHSLPAPRYRHVFEPACGNGELTAMLSHRADRITASDLSPAAVQLTRQRLGEAALKHVAVRCQRLPQEWPTGANFDLIVISEMAYYLSEAGLHELRGHAVRTLASDGALVLCHWRRPFSDRRLDTDAIHAAFDACPELHNIARHDEADFLLDVWSCSPHSVAQREGGAA